MFKSIKQIYIFSTDVELSVSWYEKLIGLSQDISEAVAGQFALIRVGSVEFCFHKADAKSPLSTGGCVVYWEVDDFDKTMSEAVSKGGVIYRGPIQIHDSPRWMAQIKDPYGNVFGIEGLKNDESNTHYESLIR